MPVRLGLSVHNAAAIRMEHLTGYVGGIVRSEKYKTSRDFFRRAGPARRCIRTKRRHFVGAGAVEFPFPSTFKSDFHCSGVPQPCLFAEAFGNKEKIAKILLTTG
jgi:hypothetical protein